MVTADSGFDVMTQLRKTACQGSYKGGSAVVFRRNPRV